MYKRQTAATVASGAFPRELRFRARDVTVVPQACEGLVEAIEAGDFDRARATAERHVAALLARLPRPQSAVLGCTHYPLMEGAFQKALGPQVKVYSQAGLVAESLEDYLNRRPEYRGSGTQSKFLTTGDPARVTAKATQFLRQPIRFEAA